MCGTPPPDGRRRKMVEKMQEGRRTGVRLALRPPQPGDGNGGQSSRLRMARAAWTPEAPAWARPRVTPSRRRRQRSWDGGLQLRGELEAGGVELHLRAVEQGVVVGGARGDLVQDIDHLDDVVQLPLGQGEGQIPQDGGGEGGPGKGLAQPVLVGALPSPDRRSAGPARHVSQHIGQGGDVLAIAVGLIEGLGEAVAHQQGEVGVLTCGGWGRRRSGR